MGKSGRKYATKSSAAIKRSDTWPPPASPSSSDRAIDGDTPVRPDRGDFKNYFPWICEQYKCPKLPKVNLYFPDDPVHLLKRFEKKDKTEKNISKLFKFDEVTKTSFVPIIEDAPSAKKRIEDKIDFFAAFDPSYNAIEILIRDCAMPYLMVQCFVYCVLPLFRLRKLTFRNVEMYPQLVAEVAYLTVECPSLSSISFERCRAFPEMNYYEMLAAENNIQTLSLRNCNVNGKALQALADVLIKDRPCASTLISLNLSSNHIGNDGASYLANTLRTNRKLKSLSLADNQITDEGFIEILKVFKDFLLTLEETTWRKMKIKLYLDKMEAVLQSDVVSEKLGTKGKKKKADRVSAKKVVTSSKEFNSSQTIRVPTFCYHDDNMMAMWDSVVCKGNFELAYLNVAYNHIEAHGLLQLYDVLCYQNKSNTKLGLKKIIIRGNNFPRFSDYSKIFSLYKQFVDIS